MSDAGLADPVAIDRLPRSSAGAAIGAFALLAVVGFVVPIVTARHFGALGIPRNDDWAYILSAFRFADGGGIDGNGWPSMNLVGQLAASAPVVWIFGREITALQVEVAALGVVGLYAVFDLARSFIRTSRALFIAVMVAVGPMWASLSVSYMTDVPAFSLALVSLALGVRGLRSTEVRVGLLWSAVVVGFAAFTVRETAIVAPLAVLLGAACTAQHRPRTMRLLAAAAGTLLVAALAFVAWRHQLPGFKDLPLAAPSASSSKSTIRDGIRSAALLGVLVAPAVVLAGPIRLVRQARARAPRSSLVALLLVAAAYLAAILLGDGWSRMLGPGNYVVPNGSLGTVTISGGPRSDLFPGLLFAVLGIVGIAACAVLVLAALPRLFDAISAFRSPRADLAGTRREVVLLAAGLGFAGASVVPQLLGVAPYDRYLLPLVPIVGVLVLLTARRDVADERRRDAAALAALLVLAALGFAFAANAASFDGSKWEVAERAAAQHGSSAVEGGFEWTNLHAGRDRYFGEDARFGKGFCVQVRAAPGDPTPRQRFRVPVWGLTGHQAWIVGVTNEANCAH